jgi:hypothetical protein
MRRGIIGLVLLAGFLAVAGQAMAQDGKSGVTIDGSLIAATAPTGGYDATVGIGIGALVDITNRVNVSNKNIKLGIRGDMSYYSWDGNFYGFGVSYKRLAFFGGPRFTIQPGANAAVLPYVEGGVELTYDDIGMYTPGFGSASTTGLSLGLAGGGGVDFLLAKNLKLGVNGRLHLISDAFVTVGVTLGLMF